MSKIKNHLTKNKTLYISGAVGVAVGISVTLVVVGRRVNAAGVVQNTVVIGSRNTVSPTIVNFAERSTSSKPVHLVGTDLYFDSLSEAARKTGHHLSLISKNVNGHISDLNGDVFELLNPA